MGDSDTFFGHVLPQGYPICVQVFVTAHESVSTKSEDMFDALKRRNYVTPTNYLEFVEGYKSLLGEKKRTLADKAGKLRGGLTKLDETTVQVGEMQVSFPI